MEGFTHTHILHKNTSHTCTHTPTPLQGDIVSILHKVDANWLEGMLNDKKGIFPLAYVEMVAEGKDWEGGCVGLLWACQETCANIECEPAMWVW